MKHVAAFIIEIWATNCPRCNAINARDHEPPHAVKCHTCGLKYVAEKTADGPEMCERVD